MKKIKAKPITECCILEKANILSVTERIKYYITKITFKTLNIKHFINNNIIVPHVQYNVNMFSMRKKSVTRAGKKRLLDKNYKWKSCTFEKSFKHRAIDLWNSLPENLHDDTLSFMKFNKLLYKYFLSQRNAVNAIFNPP